MRPIYNIDRRRPEKETAQQPARNSDEEDEDEASNDRWYLNSVRNLINVFEQRDKETRSKPFRPNLTKAKSKSYANLRQDFQANRTKEVASRFESSKRKTTVPELETIKNTALSLRTKITDSRKIDSKECILYQNQIIALLTKIGALESNGNPLIKEEKQRCLKMVQSCNTALKNKNAEPKALGAFVRNLAPPSTETVSKVQMLRGIFEAKKDNVPPTKKPEVKPRPLLALDEFAYTPYSQYLKIRNGEEQGLDASKSCENISGQDYAGVKRLLNRINDKTREAHFRTKSLTNIKVEEQDVSLKAVSVEDVAEEEVKLVSVKAVEEEPVPGEAAEESESDSGSDEQKHSSGFYSFVGDDEEVFEEGKVGEDELEEGSDDEGSTVKSLGSDGEKGGYEVYTNVKCKMANGMVNITLNGVQVE